MKITETRLKEIIKEEMEAHNQYMDHEDQEGKMARRQLENLAEYAMELASMLDDGTQLEGWVQSKITLAHDYIGKVKHYLEDELQMKPGCGDMTPPEVEMTDSDGMKFDIDDEDAYLMEN